MEIVFTNPGVDYIIRQIMGFQGEGETAFWSDSLYHFFPQLDKAYAGSLSFDERKNCRAQISEALSEAFEIDCNTLFNDLHCNVSMNPIMPRFLREHSFDVFYLNSERGAIGSSIH